MSWRQLAAGFAIIAVVIGLVGARAILAGPQPAGASSSDGAAPSASLSPSTAPTAATVSAIVSASASPSASEMPSPTATPAPVPTVGPSPPIATPRPTAVPASPAATPVPQPTDYCPYIEGTGGISYLQLTVVAGQTMEFYILQPVQQTLIHLEVDYPNGETVSLGDQWLTPQPDGSTKVDWVWTVPASMTPGTGTVRSTGGCGVFSYNQTFTFTITAP